MEFLTYSLFTEKMTILSELLSGGPTTSLGVEAYYRAIRVLSDDRFLQVVDRVLATCQRFPTPALILEQANAIASREESARFPALPAAPLEDIEGACPRYVRVWIEKRRLAYRDLHNQLVQARRTANSRFLAHGLSSALAAIRAEEDEQVIAARRACCDFSAPHPAYRPGFPDTFLQTTAHTEMASIRESLEQETYEFELTDDDLVDF